MPGTAASQPVITRAFSAPSTIIASASAGRALKLYSWFVLGWNIAVILWGAVVRATGSGAGCGNHWPLCNGEVIPTSPRVATMIEFTHRAMTGGATVTILVLLLWTFRATRSRHLARITAVASAILLVNEAFLGALLVKLGYVVNNQSAGRFIVLPIHLANTLLLLAALALTAHFLARETGFMNGSVEYRFVGLAVASIVATIAVGVSGSLAALGDTLFPSSSFAEALAQDLAHSGPWILRFRWVHPASSVLATLFIVAIVAVSAARLGPLRSIANTLAGLLLFQFVLGAADVILRAPTWMQIVHLLGADVFWSTLVVLLARIVVVPLGCPGSQCALARPPSNRSRWLAEGDGSLTS